MNSNVNKCSAHHIKSRNINFTYNMEGYSLGKDSQLIKYVQL